jgi:hypothetical protein
LGDVVVDERIILEDRSKKCVWEQDINALAVSQERIRSKINVQQHLIYERKLK